MTMYGDMAESMKDSIVRAKRFLDNGNAEFASNELNKALHEYYEDWGVMTIPSNDLQCMTDLDANTP